MLLTASVNEMTAGTYHVSSQPYVKTHNNSNRSCVLLCRPINSAMESKPYDGRYTLLQQG